MVTGGESWVISQQYKTIHLTNLLIIDYMTEHRIYCSHAPQKNYFSIGFIAFYLTYMLF